MANTIKLKKSSVPAKIPQVSDLEFGELAINYHDGSLFFKTSTNTISTLASTAFVSVTGNVTGANIVGTQGVYGNIITTSIDSGDSSIISIVPDTNFQASVDVDTDLTVGQTLSVGAAVSVTGNVTGSYFIGNGSQLTGISVDSTRIISGTSNVAVVAVDGNVAVAVNGVANTAVFGQGTMTVKGPLATPRVLDNQIVVSDGVNAVMFAPVTFENTANVLIPDDSALTIFNPSDTNVDGGAATMTYIT